ncbi:hypothetical protein BV20DRAFT_242826 [Pilatotrama ljubarskyi]|nr:hypothetical protein BV20DRAFT_242826 [Pilatotrama ljubarskyi]
MMSEPGEVRTRGHRLYSPTKPISNALSGYSFTSRPDAASSPTLQADRNIYTGHAMTVAWRKANATSVVPLDPAPRCSQRSWSPCYARRVHAAPAQSLRSSVRICLVRPMQQASGRCCSLRMELHKSAHHCPFSKSERRVAGMIYRDHARMRRSEYNVANSHLRPLKPSGSEFADALKAAAYSLAYPHPSPTDAQIRGEDAVIPHRPPPS